MGGLREEGGQAVQGSSEISILQEGPGAALGEGDGMIVYIVGSDAEGIQGGFTDKSKADELFQTKEQENPRGRYWVEMWEVEE